MSQNGTELHASLQVQKRTIPKRNTAYIGLSGDFVLPRIQAIMYALVVVWGFSVCRSRCKKLRHGGSTIVKNGTLRKVSVLVLGSLLFISIPATAQGMKGQPEVSMDIRHDTSPPVAADPRGFCGTGTAKGYSVAPSGSRTLRGPGQRSA